MAVNPIPEGYHSVTPYLIVSQAKAVIEFMKAAFGAKEEFRQERPDGTIMHSQFKIGDSMVELAEAGPEWPAMPAAIHLYVPDADATYHAALKAGAKTVREPDTQFYGDRECGVQDVAGNFWFIATRVEIVSEAEMKRRAEKLGKV